MTSSEKLSEDPEKMLGDFISQMFSNIVTWGVIAGCLYWLIPIGLFGKISAVGYTLIAGLSIVQNFGVAIAMINSYRKSEINDAENFPMKYIVGIFVVRFFESLVVL
ncbi:MAG: hypothetical protein ABEK50_11260 [bacterium]